MKVNIQQRIHKNNNRLDDNNFSSSLIHSTNNNCDEKVEVKNYFETDVTLVTDAIVHSRRRKVGVIETVPPNSLHHSLNLGSSSKKMKTIDHHPQQQAVIIDLITSNSNQKPETTTTTTNNDRTVHDIKSPSQDIVDNRNNSSSNNSSLSPKGVHPSSNTMRINHVTTSISESRKSGNIGHHNHHFSSHHITQNTRNNNNNSTLSSHDNGEESYQIIKKNRKDDLASLAPQSCPYDLSPDSYLRKLFSSSLGYTPKTRVTSDLVGQLFPPIDDEVMVNNYKPDIVSAVRENDLAALKTFHQDDGRSLSCCNRYGETLLHMACRRGYHSIVSYLVLEASVPTRLADDCGRNVLHDAFWNRNTQYEIVDLLTRLDPILLLSCDNRGYTPFSYARKEHWPVWRQFLWDRREHMKIALENDIELVDQFFK